ncbi:MAG TPA: right-handed parallel beta-helix repeat-containing protein [Candidatus Krumholzibacteria bacterium]
MQPHFAKRRLAFAAQLVAALLLFASTLSRPALGRTWYIKADGTGDAPTIQAGVDLASPGDIVLVGPGTYADMSTVDIDGVSTTVCVAISKDIQLVSEDGPVTTTIGNPAVQVAIYFHDAGAGATVNGFRIATTFFPYGCVTAAKPSAAPNFQIGIKCRNFSGTLVGNHVANNGIGIELTASPAIVTENEVTFAAEGVQCEAGSDAQIGNNVLHDCAIMIHCVGSAPEIIANDMYEGCEGITSGDGSSPTVRKNTIHEFSPHGIVAGGMITVEDNRFTNTNLSIFLNGITGTGVVRGNVFYNQISGAISLSDNPNGTIIIEQNTIDRTTFGAAIFCQRASSPIIRRNIIVHSVGGVSCVWFSFPTLECNNIFDAGSGYAGDCPDQTGVNGNISADPQFCGAAGSGNYALQSDSPCAAGNHPVGYQCEGIGAFSVGCATVSTKAATWGAIKAIYRR